MWNSFTICTHVNPHVAHEKVLILKMDYWNNDNNRLIIKCHMYYHGKCDFDLRDSCIQRHAFHLLKFAAVGDLAVLVFEILYLKHCFHTSPCKWEVAFVKFLIRQSYMA